jgi:thiamine-phosphate pyrophosphorylase
MTYKGFYFITDSSLTKKGIVSDAEAAIKGGATIVQYREKCMDTGPMIDKALQLKDICAGKAALIINDRVDIALAVNADGVHLGQTDMDYKNARRLLGNSKVIGVTVHNLEEAKAAEAMGADYLGVSPVFHTDTKGDAGPAAGLGTLREIRAGTSLPIAAIGGIKLENLREVLDAGADTVCAMSATIGKDVESKVREFSDIISRH